MEFLNEVLGLNEFIHSTVRTLSLGQRMRADLAKVLFLDEPTIGLDVVVKEKLRNAIKEINRQYETTVILTTHDLSDIEELCNRIIIIDKGKKVYDGSVSQLKDKYGTMRTIDIRIKESETVGNINISKELNLGPKDAELLLEGNNIKINFDRNKIGVSNIVNYIMSKFQVIDMNIKETAIEEIVKKIYNNEVSL